MMSKNKDELPRYLRNAPKKFDHLKTAFKKTESQTPVIQPVSLGEMNGWKKGKYPKAYRDCIASNHPTVDTGSSPTYKRYTCTICNISWCVDSSG